MYAHRLSIRANGFLDTILGSDWHLQMVTCGVLAVGIVTALYTLLTEGFRKEGFALGFLLSAPVLAITLGAFFDVYPLSGAKSPSWYTVAKYNCVNLVALQIYNAWGVEYLYPTSKDKTKKH